MSDYMERIDLCLFTSVTVKKMTMINYVNILPLDLFSSKLNFLMFFVKYSRGEHLVHLCF